MNVEKEQGIKYKEFSEFFSGFWLGLQPTITLLS